MTRLSLTGPQFSSTFDPFHEWATVCEQAGFDGLFLFDHLVPLGDATRPVLELAAAWGAVAAATSRVQVGSLVMRAPLRGPELSAAVAVTTATIGGDRLVVGLGAGDSRSREESLRFGQVVESLDDRIDAVRRTALSIRAAVPHLPIWIGGLHERMRRLAADVADGWNAWGVDAHTFDVLGRSLPNGIERTWGGAVIVGRDTDDVARAVERRGSAEGAIVGTVTEVARELRRYVDAGASHLVLSVLPNRRDRWEVAAGLLSETR